MINTPSNLKDYNRQLRAALDDEFLSAALDAFFRSYRENRPNVFAGLDFAALAAEIGQIKDSGLPHIMELFEQFKEQAMARGVHVHLGRRRRRSQPDHCRNRPGSRRPQGGQGQVHDRRRDVF